MKKKGIQNSELSKIITGMGHGDKLVIADCGLPIPKGAEVIDLAVKINIPKFLQVLKVVLEELVVEEAIIAAEMENESKDLYSKLLNLLKDIKINKVSHNEFKEINNNGKNISFVRTGEATPFANIILIGGVNF